MKVIKLILCLLFFIFLLAPEGVTAQTVSVGRYEVFEATFTYIQPAGNPWEDANGSYITAIVTSSSNKIYNIDGFYYDTNTYKIRFTPAELGTYNYTATLRGGSQGTKTFTGSFNSIASTQKGFVRKNPINNYRFQFEDGSFFTGIGINDCWGTPNDPQWYMKAFIDDGVLVGPDQYFQTYGAAGFNLFRWNPGNCSFGIWGLNNSTGNTYLLDEGKSGDLLLGSAKKYGFHNLFTFWWGPPSLSTSDTDPETGKMKRAINYAIARYGAYIDMWEMTNEQDASTTSKTWLKYYTDYVRSRDPYNRLITNSHPIADDWFWEVSPNVRVPLLDFRSPHPEMYDGYTILNSTTNGFTTNSPVIVGEGYTAIPGCGNCATSPINPWSVRGTVWSSVMSGLGVIWWNSSFGLCSGCMPHNEYLGYKERAGVKIALDYLKTMPKDSTFQILPSSNTDVNQGVKVYGLFSPNKIWAYFLRQLNGTGSVTTTTTINIPFSGTASWIDPVTGNVLSSTAVTSGSKSFTTSSFSQDLALKIESSSGATATPSPVPPTPTPVPAGDINSDGKIDVYDLMLVFQRYATSNIPADLNKDATVNLLDAGIVIGNMGK